MDSAPTSKNSLSASPSSIINIFLFFLLSGAIGIYVYMQYNPTEENNKTQESSNIRLTSDISGSIHKVV